MHVGYKQIPAEESENNTSSDLKYTQLFSLNRSTGIVPTFKAKTYFYLGCVFARFANRVNKI